MGDNLADQWALLTQRKCEGNETELVELVSVPGAGRGLRCSRDVGGGEVVLEDWAVVIGEGIYTLLQHNNVCLL